MSQGWQPVQRSCPSTVCTHSQQPKQSLQSTVYLSSQQLQCSFPETFHLCNQHLQSQQLEGPLPDAVLPFSKQSQGCFLNAMLGDNYPIQGFISDATLKQSQQLQRISLENVCVDIIQHRGCHLNRGHNHRRFSQVIFLY